MVRFGNWEMPRIYNLQVLSRLTCFILTLGALPGGILKNSPKSSSMVTIASSVQRVQLKDFSWYEIPTHSGSSSHNFWHLNCVCFPMCLFFSHIHSSIHNSNKIYKKKGLKNLKKVNYFPWNAIEHSNIEFTFPVWLACFPREAFGVPGVWGKHKVVTVVMIW